MHMPRNPGIVLDSNWGMPSALTTATSFLSATAHDPFGLYSGEMTREKGNVESLTCCQFIDVVSFLLPNTLLILCLDAGGWCLKVHDAVVRLPIPRIIKLSEWAAPTLAIKL